MATISRKRQADASPVERMRTSLDNIVRDVRDRTSHASQDLGRHSDGLQCALRQNAGWRTLDAKSRERAIRQIEQFIDRQRQHLQDRWERTSDFPEQLDEIAVHLTDEQEAEGDGTAADLDGRHRRQLCELADLAARTEQAIANAMHLDDDRLTEERGPIAVVLSTGSCDLIDAAFKRVDQDRSATWRMYRDLRRLEKDIDRAAVDILRKRTPPDGCNRRQLDY